MTIKKILLPFLSFILRNIPSHYYRKIFAKIVGPYFDGYIANTAYGFPMIARWYDNTNRVSFEGSYGIVADFIKKLPHNSMFIDIGANQGCTSIFASNVLKKNENGVVLAFEPSPSLYNLMKKNIDLNNCNNVFTFNKAISSKEAELFLDESDLGNSGASHISDKGCKVIASPLKFEHIKEFGIHNNIYVKIDTEGYELSVLHGINDLFEAKLIRKLVIEIDDINLMKYNCTPLEIYDYLDNYNFKPTIGLQKKGHYDEVFIEK